MDLYKYCFFQTPKKWLDQWDGPNDSATYIRSVIVRTISVNKMKSSADKLSDKIDLDKLFHPKTFLIALKQQSAK